MQPTATISRSSRKTKRREDEEEECVDAAVPPPAPAVRVSEPKVLPTALTPAPFQVIVRAYGNTPWKVNHVYEFVGELDLTPQAAPDDMDIEWKDADSATVQEKARAIEFIPTLHATGTLVLALRKKMLKEQGRRQRDYLWSGRRFPRGHGQPDGVGSR